jgi:hypothetical protein
MTPGTIRKCGPNSRHPGQWAKVLVVSPDGKRVFVAVYPPGHPKPAAEVRRGQ